MKKVFALIVVMVMLLQVPCFAIAAEKESGTPKHIPRIVSVVFDNSGSMYSQTDRWAYASYAMQAFSAMMGEDDVLHVTYINNPKSSTKIELGSSKAASVDNFERIMFGGGTANKMEDAAKILVKEYKTYGKNAKYYLVVMADGELDSDEGVFSQKLPEASNYAKKELAGAEYNAIFFSMLDKQPVISGVDCRNAKNSDEIIEKLSEISADIMGRTDIRNSCTVSGNSISFELQYPALSIAVFHQKKSTSVNGVNVSVSRSGSSSRYNVDTYYIDCPDEIIKDYSTSVFEEKKAEDPPSGLVSLVDNGSSSLPKGKYTITLSGCDMTKGDLVVLVEPAVKIGCTYYIEDDETPMTFDEMMSNACEGNSITVKCGLYELNEDGSLGDVVPESILSPDFNVYVNDVKVGNKVQNQKNAYIFKLSKDYEGKDIEIEATLKGYAPFVYRETFGAILVKPEIDTSNGIFSQPLTLTLELWESWKQNKEAISIPTENAANDILSYFSISFDGTDAFLEGKLDALPNVGVSGGNITYIPKAKSGVEFSSLPDKFNIAIIDNASKELVGTIKVNVVKPKYKIDVDNPLNGVNLGLEDLKTNTKGVAFTLMADYEGDGNYVLAQADENITVDLGALTGDLKCEKGKAVFVPKFDASSDNPDDILGKDHKIYATAVVDGSNVKSEEVTLSIAKPSYKFEIKNPFEGQTLNLDMLKINSEGISFVLMADYAGDGNYVAVEDASIDIEHGVLCGKVTCENGIAVFVPSYDPKNNKDVSLSDIMGKDHVVAAKATVNGTELSSENVVLSVGTVSYKIVLDNGITEAFTLDTIKTNDKKITFSIQADYENDGSFTEVASWDRGVYDLLTLTAGELPGRFETVYDGGGNPIGKSFTPLYDENNNGGVVFTKVAGRVHTIKASIEQYGVSGETTVEVLAPVYEIAVRKDAITVVDVDIRNNTEGVEFVVTRDGRALSAAELEGLEPYSIELNKNKKSIALVCSVKEDETGVAYLSCRPDYKGRFYISNPLFNWVCMLRVKDGEMTATYTLGQNSATAIINVDTNELAFIIFIIVLIIIAIIIWIIICFVTRRKIARGVFFIATFKRKRGTCSYVIDGTPIQVKSYGIKHFFHGSLICPFACPKIPVGNYICTTKVFVGGTPKIVFEQGRDGRYPPHQKGSLGIQWGSLIAGTLDRNTELSVSASISNSMEFYFSNGNFIVNDESKETITIVTYASNKTIRNEKNKIELFKRTRNKK